MSRKRKCDHCVGKGGYAKQVGMTLRTLWVSCFHCKGRGSWWVNDRPKKKREGK